MPPKVQSLDEIIAQLDPAFAGQRNIITQQQALLPGQKQAAIGGVEAARVNANRDINTGANSKGLAFSGIPIAEQARYTGEKYAPALAGLEGDYANKDLQLQQTMAQLAGDQRLKAIDTRSSQQKVLDDYLENERQRAFQAQQAELTRQAEARAASAKSGTSASDTNRAAANEMYGLLDRAVGKDGKVSPQTYNTARARWTSQGFSPADFDKFFRNYVNESHAYDYGYGSKPGAAKAPTYGTINGRY